MSVILSVSASAQGRFFVGGSLGFSNATTSSLSTETRSTSFTIMPEIGYVLNDRLVLGLSAGYAGISASDKAQITIAGMNFSSSDYISNIVIEPYVRYKVTDLGPVGLWAQGTLSYDYAGLSHSYVETFSIGAVPVVTWQASNRFCLYSKLNFCSLNYSVGYVWEPKQYSENISVSNFSIGADSTPSAISIGFVYSL